MQKSYIIDTNVLIDNNESIEILRNGCENEIYITETVLHELDKLKNDIRVFNRVVRVIHTLLEKQHIIKVLKSVSKSTGNNDDKIIEEILASNIDNPILVTNDNLMRFKAIKRGIQAQNFEHSKPFESDSELYTGFNDNSIVNSFYLEDGVLYRNKKDDIIQKIDYNNDVWKVSPKHYTQNAFFTLAMDDDIDIVSSQSNAGYGKTFCALAAAFHLAYQMKKFSKIYVFKANIEVGTPLGFLPGDMNEKMAPYFRPIINLIYKLMEYREYNKLFVDEVTLNPKKIELLPINFLRGDNIDNAIVIIDEVQNLSRDEVRTSLSRMGQNVKCFCLGDVRQVDNKYLNSHNNGLNWIVKSFKGQNNYGHIVLDGEKSRGPIADLVIKTKL